VSGANHQELIERVLSDLYNNLVDSQQELGIDFESVLYENIEELYEN
jgi:hypothetical protein